MDAPSDLPFPHVSQAYLIERYVTALDGTALSDVAALRNLAIGALHQAGRHDSTEATRWASLYMHRPFTISDSRHDLETAVARPLMVC